MSTQARKHTNTQTRKHAKHASTQARKHAKHASTQARQASDLADSKKNTATNYTKESKFFFENLDSSKMTNDKTFGKNIQPFFSEKRKTDNKITIVNENEGMIRR